MTQIFLDCLTLLAAVSVVLFIRNSSPPGPDKSPYFFGDETRGRGGYFSPWFNAKFKEQGIPYMSAAQMMLALKAELFGDTETKEQILATDDPEKHRTLDRNIRGFDPDIWSKESYSIALRVNRAKFSISTLGSSHERTYLLSSGVRELVYASPTDRHLGIGFGTADAPNTDREQWGENIFGKAATDAREEIRTFLEEQEAKFKRMIAKYDDPDSGWFVKF